MQLWHCCRVTLIENFSYLRAKALVPMAELLEPMEMTPDFMSDKDRERAYEIELFRAFMSGKREAFTKLYLRFRQRVFSYCLRMLGSSAEAEDLYQEVFIRVYQRAHQFAEDKSLACWIFTIA